MMIIRMISLLLMSLALSVLQGCSMWKREQIVPVKKFTYDYQEPTRSPINVDRMRSLKLMYPPTSDMRNFKPSTRSYYSANGNLCRILDINGSEIACVVEGRWHMPRSVVASSLLR